MHRTVELWALAFQTLVTGLLALVYYGLWRARHRPYDATWAMAWGSYAARLAFITAYIAMRRTVWLFLHQVATGVVALLLLHAAIQFSRQVTWRRRTMAWLTALVVASSYALVYGVHDFMVAGIFSVVLLSGVTLWTAVVFWKHRARVPSGGATVLALGFTLWGLHHLDYPLLRPLGTGVLFGVFADVLFIVVTAIGAVFLVLDHDRQALESRRAQLEQLTHLLLTAQEDERRRIARELHDEAGQILTAVKIDLDLAGRRGSSELVGKALAQVRDLSNLLRPRVLDDLGLVPAIRAPMEDFSRGTRRATRRRRGPRGRAAARRSDGRSHPRAAGRRPHAGPRRPAQEPRVRRFDRGRRRTGGRRRGARPPPARRRRRAGARSHHAGHGR